MRRARRLVLHEGGMTLPELLAAIGVAAVLMAISAPSLQGLIAGYRLKGASQQVFVDLQNARMAAVKENNSFVFRLTGPTTYEVLDDDNNNGEPDNDERLDTYDIAEDQPNVTMSMSRSDEVVFLPNGRAVTNGWEGMGGLNWIELTDAREKSKWVVVTTGGLMRITLPELRG